MVRRDELHHFLGDMVVIERQVEALVGGQLLNAESHPRVTEAVGRYQRMIEVQREALEARLRSVGGEAPASPARVAPLRVLAEAKMHDARSPSRALHVLYTAFNHAVFGYAMLHAVAHRFYDSQASGNTADLAETHMREYAAAAQEINQMISDAVVSKLSQRGQECQCRCPSCTLGICLCPPHGTNTVNEVWRETSPSASPGGIRLRLPRSDSVVARVGLREGDRVAAVDDQEITSDLDTGSMQTAIRRHQSGEKIRLRVRRATDDVEVIVTRP